MKKHLFAFLCFSMTWLSQAQGWVHNGAHVVANNGTFIVIQGPQGNYKAQVASRLIFNGDVELSFTGNWINNSAGAIFMTNNGTVQCQSHPANQYLGGWWT